MGWNSWNCYGPTVTQEKIEKQAEAMVRSGLRDHGFVYINIDDGWQGERGGPFNAIQGNSKFPDMKGLCDYVHSLGLKIGIYSTPWPKSYAGYTGGYNHEMEDARQWAEWGIDFLKYDWSMSDPREPSEEYVRRMRDALDATGKEIVFSLSNSAPISKAHIWSKYANMWRTTGDIEDTWESVSRIGFSQDEWARFAGPGHWNDPDMMVLGYVGWGEHQRPSRLTRDEQITHMTLWCLLAAPLLLGCDLTRLDDFLLGVLTNDEVLAVDQDPLGVQARRVRRDGETEVWARPLRDGSKAVGLFNRGEQREDVTVYWTDIGISGKAHVRDLWHHRDLGPISESLSTPVNPHGAEMFVVRQRSG
jgi:alpha-galactosidase